MKPLSPLTLNLEKSTLIEASAGTGKTYTIATLFCRLVALGYSVESILVVTFTEAAAAELKLRIRRRLFDTLKQLVSNTKVVQDDLVMHFSRQEEISLICQRLQHAITCFDQASIMTIHSFCMKVLKENAFESHSLFDIELIPDNTPFLHQVSYDFFMNRISKLDPIFLSFLKHRQVTPENFIQSFRQVVARPDIILKPDGLIFKDVVAEYRSTVNKIDKHLDTRIPAIIEKIQTHKGLDKRSYTKKNVPKWLESAVLKLKQDGNNCFFIMTEKGDSLYKFTRSRMASKTKSDASPPRDELFDLCENLLEFYAEFENNLNCLKLEFFSFFRQELTKIKTNQGTFFFDDLVNELALALESGHAATLIHSVRGKYTACLIDEFQDTDPKQYDIFSTLFTAKDTPFFMIGDPKQAIYAFRGGDIFAYLKASQNSEQRFTLDKNYRSAPLLVSAINEVFLNKNNPFLFNAIEFSKVDTPSSAIDRMIDKGKSIPPLHFCMADRETIELDKNGFISKDTANLIIPNMVANDILSLFHSDKRLINKENQAHDHARVAPNDIAVLVRTNRQAQQIQNALKRAGIPSFLSKSGSVFDSAQAIELHDILWAVYEPENLNFIKGALSTSIFNLSIIDIAILSQSEDTLSQWQNQFHQLKHTWETRGFVPMVMTLFHSSQTFLKENQHMDERALTNFYHLMELISQVSLKQQFSSYSLLKWVERQLNKDLRDEHSDELRLETDKKAVAIVTIHKSKGLEYPVVYLPYLWEGALRSPTENVLFHDPDNNHTLTLDLGSTDHEFAQTCLETEEKAEQRRLLYVGLTRASAMVKIIWGGFKSVDTSALGSLLHDHKCEVDSDMIQDIDLIGSRTDNGIMVTVCDAVIKGHYTETSDINSSELSAKTFIKQIEPAWRMSSFSSIIQSTHVTVLTEKQPIPGNVKSKKITLERFPKGAGSGDYFHSIFEEMDFIKGENEVNHWVDIKSGMFGIHDNVLVQMAKKAVKEILETKLSAPDDHFNLENISLDQRFNELEFTFPMHSFKPDLLKSAFTLSDEAFKISGYIEKIDQLDSPSSHVNVGGYMKGFIDLIIQHKGKWYILDYKSNYLGDTYEAYSQNAIVDVMSDHHYYLQYHLYLVALHRYLTRRLENYSYESHFGGVFYLFIRGMHPQFGSEYGVYFHKPEENVVTHLSDGF